MRMISHLHRETGRAGEAVVAIRCYTLECELERMRGARISQLTLTVTPPGAESDTECVDAGPELLAEMDGASQQAVLRSLLDRLAGTYHGRPMGHLAERAARLLPVEVCSGS
jgi:hypothetical protein